jgi:AcrR family transcriptional regulator
MGADEIRQVAIALFGDRGYPSTSMRDISEAVGILPGSLYTHIQSKEALLLNIVEEGTDRYLAVLAPIAKSADPADARLREAIKAFVRVATENIGLSQVAIHQWKHLTEANQARVARKRNEFEKLFSKMVTDGVKSGVFRAPAKLKLAVYAIIGMLNWVPEWYSPKGANTPDEIGEALADMVLSGLVGASVATPKQRR